jgi:hypothetical protein
MYAKIVTDHLDVTDTLGPEFDRTNQVIICEFHKQVPTDLLDVRLLDDDRELYYTAVADDDALEGLFTWAMKDSGVAILQTKQDGEWKDVIS